jgi:integrase
MSSIRKRGKIWFLDIRIGEKRIRESLDTSDKHVAAIKAKIRERELQGPAVFQRSTLEEFQREYLLWVEPLKSPETVGVERNALQRLQKAVRIKYLDEISVRIADQFASDIAREVKPVTVNFYIRTLRAIFATALKWKYIASNPFREVKLPGYELPPPRILAKRELSKIFEITERDYREYLPLFQFYLCTGLRRSEALHLEWDDINEEGNYLIVKGTKGKRVRYVPLLPQTVQILRHRRQQPRPFSEFNADRVTNTFSAIAKTAGVKNTSLHDLRRSFASYLTDLGIPMAFVQKWLGHTTFDVTKDYYIGLSDDMWQRMKRFDLELFKQN